MSLEHAPTKADGPGGRVYLTSKQVRERYGGISDMSLWRWLNNPALSFPKPLVINRRRFFALSGLEKFEVGSGFESRYQSWKFRVSPA